MVVASDVPRTVTSAPSRSPRRQSGSAFPERVRREFGRHAASYDDQAQMQRGVAWRLAHHCGSHQPGPHLPRGPRADLGAGSGNLTRALMGQVAGFTAVPVLQLDICPELLALGPTPPSHRVRWDLNRGLPARLNQAALLASNFALQWLEAPTAHLCHWCSHLAPGGWLLLGVPTSGSYPQWRQAARVADVPCTALELPSATALIATVKNQGLELLHCRTIHFTRGHQGGRNTLRHLRLLGAGCSRSDHLTTTEIRRLLACWPDSTPLTWEVLVLVGRRPRCAW